jgi:hypothetical protein
MQADQQIEKKFEEYRNYLVREATKLAGFIALFWKLHERQADRREEMNIAPAFFGFVTDALLISMVVWVDKLFDERGERGIFDFLQFVEQNMNILTTEQLRRRKSYPDGHPMLAREAITAEVINQDRASIRDLDCLHNFRILRDKFYSHFDKEYFFDREHLRDQAPTWGDLTKIIGVVSDVIDRYSTAYDGQHFLLMPMNIEDLDRLLDRLHACTKPKNS